MRLIDADRLVPKLKKFHDMINPRLIGGKAARELILNIIKYCKDEQYKIDPESLRGHGKWVWNDNAIDWSIGGWICNNCGVINKNLPYDKNINPYVWSGSKYCPNCGARMDLGEGEA